MEPKWGPDAARDSHKFFPNKGKWEMVESTGSGIKQTGAGIPIWPHASCVTGQVT